MPFSSRTGLLRRGWLVFAATGAFVAGCTPQVLDGHGTTTDSAGLPGGIGDANSPSNPFLTKAGVDKYPEFRWRTDQD